MKCNTQICIRLPLSDVEAIHEIVGRGISLNNADFIRTAIREKIARIQGA